MRNIISAMQVSVDGYIEDSGGKLDWVESWEDEYDLLDRVDLCVLGSVMHPGYEQYCRRPQPREHTSRSVANDRRAVKSNTPNGLPKRRTLSSRANR